MRQSSTKAAKGGSTTAGKAGSTRATNMEGGNPPSQTDGSNCKEPLFFYMPDAKYGEFCQWFPATFTVSKSEIAKLVERSISDDPNSDPEETITFSCAEQFMMYCKAARFGDADRQRRVLATKSPKEQKALGKETVGFTAESWDQVKSEVVTAGNIAKFGQDSSLRRKLLATGERLLAEAASRDRVWGIGYSEKHATSHQKHWGENRLGKALMVAREQLRKEEESQRAPWETDQL